MTDLVNPMAVYQAASIETAAMNSFLSAIKITPINTPKDRSDAVEATRQIKAHAALLEEKRKSIVEPLRKAITEVDALFKPPMDGLKNTENKFKEMMLEYDQKVEAENRRRQAELEERARREREKLRLERERIEAAARAKAAEEARKAAEARARAQAEQDEKARAEALRQAQEAEAKAAKIEAAAAQKSETLAMREAVVVAPIFQDAKTEGTVARKTWKVKSVDVVALARAVGAGQAPPNFITPNLQDLNAYARSLRENARVPGVEFEAETKIAIR